MRTRDSIEVTRGSWRLAIEFGLLFVVLFAILGGVIYGIVSASQSESLERTLINATRVDSPQDAPPGVFVITIRDNKTEGSRNLPSGLPDNAAVQQVGETGIDLQETKALGDRTYRIRTTALDGQVTQVAVDLHESHEELQRLSVALIISGIIAALAAGLISAWMARRAMRPMAEALALQRRFVMDASHELRTPLTLLSTRAQILRRRITGKGETESASHVAHGLDEIVQDSRVLAEILEDLLIAADPREEAHKDRLDLAQLATDVVVSMAPDAGARGLALQRAGSSTPIMVTAARVSMQRLFTALIANALDHATSHVEVDVKEQGREVVIRISDDGPGFPEGMDEHAFERFASSRPRSHEHEQPRHYGLGLALVSEVAVRHGGGVSVETGAPDRGATVVVRLPLHR
ncbi:MAG: HAMP domain-containing sensor histidine kinase [Terrimesophilobacter sp.]